MSNASALMALVQRQKAKTSFTKTVKPPAGRSRWKILPSWRKIEDAPAGLSDADKAIWAAQFFHDFGQHFIKDATGKIVAVAVCTDKTFGRPCQVCAELGRAIMATTDDVTKAQLEEAQSGGRVLFNAIHLDGPTGLEEVVLLECPPSVLNGKKGTGGIINKLQDWPNLFDLANGADVIIEKTGAGKTGTSYDASIVPAQPGVVINPAVLTKLHNLDQYVAAESAGSNQRALLGVSQISGLMLAAPAAGMPSLSSLAQSTPPAAAAQMFTDIPDIPTAAAQPVAAPPAQPVVIPAAAPIPQPAPQPVLAPNATQAIDPAVLAQAMAMIQAQQAAAAAQVAQPAVQQAPVQPAVQAAAPAPASVDALEEMLKGLGG